MQPLVAGVNRFELLLTESKSIVLTITLYAIDFAVTTLQIEMTTYWLFILAALSIKTPNRFSLFLVTCNSYKTPKVVNPAGADSRSRTNNLLITNQLLYHWAIPAHIPEIYTVIKSYNKDLNIVKGFAFTSPHPTPQGLNESSTSDIADLTVEFTNATGYEDGGISS